MQLCIYIKRTKILSALETYSLQNKKNISFKIKLFYKMRYAQAVNTIHTDSYLESLLREQSKTLARLDYQQVCITMKLKEVELHAIIIL